MKKLIKYEAKDGKLFDTEEDGIAHEVELGQQEIKHQEQSKKHIKSRVLNAIRRAKEDGIELDCMTDEQIIRNTRNIGMKCIPMLRQMLGDRDNRCPHCGASLNISNALNEPRGDGL